MKKHHQTWLAWGLSALMVMLALGSGCGPAPKKDTDRLFIASAASLQYAMGELVAGFREEHPQWPVDVVYGSSGNFFAQLMSRAPFDIFFAADMAYPAALLEEGMAVEQDIFRYAVGRLAIWLPDDSRLDLDGKGIEVLLDPAVSRVAIANPNHAPYGVAAVAALKDVGIYDVVAPSLLLGENVAQAAQFIESGSADVGIIALALALAPAMADKGSYLEIPLERFPPMEQGGVILPWARNREAAEAFRDFVLGEKGQRVLKAYGFFMPGE